MTNSMTINYKAIGPAVSISAVLLGLVLLLAAPFAMGQFINGDPSFAGAMNYCVSSSAANTYTCTLARPITTLTDGQEFLVRLVNAPSASFTINIDSTGAITVKKISGGSIVNAGSGDVVANQLFRVAYRLAGNEFHIIGAAGSAGATGATGPTGATGATGSGSSAVGAGRFLPYWGGARTFFLPASSVNRRVNVWKWVFPYTATITHVTLDLQAAAGTGGAVIAGIYSADGSTLLGFFRATQGGSPDAGTTGAKLIAANANFSVTGGTTYLMAVTSDSATTSIYAWDAGSGSHSNVINNQDQYWGTCANTGSGTGSGLTLPATCGTISATGIANPPIWVFNY